MAGKVSLDLKQFKHVTSDDKSTTLQHADGHKLVLSHRSLSPESQAQLKALAPLAKADETPVQAQEASATKMAKGGKVKMADGGDVANDSSPGVDLFNKITGAGPDTNPQKLTLDQMTPEQKQMLMSVDPSVLQHALNMAGAVAGGIAPAASVEANSAAEGLQALEGHPAPFDKTVVVPEKPTPIGKVTVRDAKGGMVKKMADGGGVAPDALSPDAPQDPTANLYTTDPNDAAPALQQAYQTGMENKVKDEKGKLALRAMAMSRDLPATVEAALPPIDNKTLQADALKSVSNQQDQAQQAKMAQAQSDSSNDAEIAAQRAKLGLPVDLSTTDNAPAKADPQAAVTAAGAQIAQPNGLPGLGTNDAQGMMQAGYQNQLQGINQTAAAQGQLGVNQSAILQKQAQDQMVAKQAFQDHYNELDQERKAHIQDIQNGQIDPNKYWDSHSKIASGIGMILAGFNPTNNPNAAIGFLKSQMDNNLIAQRANLDSKQNLLAANMRQFGNLKDATEMTRIMQNDVVSNQLQAAAATAQSPMAKAAALKASGQLQMEAAPMFQNFAMRRAMMNLSANGQPGAIDQMLGYMRVQNPEMAKEMESRYVPGVGLGSTPIPQEARQQIVATKNVNDLMNKSLEFSAQHRGSVDPAVIAQAHTIQNQLIGTIKQAQHDGVYKPSEAEFLTSQIGGSPASFLANVSSVPKIKELQQIKQSEYSNLLNAYGIKGQQLPQSQAQNMPIKGADGKMYVKTPDGKYYVPYQAGK